MTPSWSAVLPGKTSELTILKIMPPLIPSNARKRRSDEARCIDTWAITSTSIKKDLKKAYLHIWQWPAGGKLSFDGFSSKIAKIYLLADNKSLKFEQDQESAKLSMEVPEAAPTKGVSVVVLEFEDKMEVDPGAGPQYKPDTARHELISVRRGVIEEIKEEARLVMTIRKPSGIPFHVRINPKAEGVMIRKDGSKGALADLKNGDTVLVYSSRKKLADARKIFVE